MTARVINIPNATASVTRTNINDALAALGSTNSGATEPPGSLNNMLWYDTATHILKLKAEVGSDWISIGYFDQSTDTFRIFDDTQLVDASGTATGGVLGDQTTATWQAGTGTTESLVSPAKVLAAIGANSISETARDVTGDAGYLKFSNGFIFQWDNWTGSHGTRNFPIAFPNACLGFSYNQYSGWYENWNGYKISASQYVTNNTFQGNNAARATNQAMFSIGY